MMDAKELIKNARIIADSIHVHSGFQDWEAAEKDTLEKCADALEVQQTTLDENETQLADMEKRIAELETQEPTEKQVVDYCRKRCLVIITGELFQRMKSKFSGMPKNGEWISVEDRLPEDGKTVLCAIYHTDLIVAHEGETIEEAAARCQAEAANHPYMVIGCYYDGAGWSDDVFGAPMVCEPSYWLEIPPMPELRRADGFRGVGFRDR